MTAGIRSLMHTSTAVILILDNSVACTSPSHAIQVSPYFILVGLYLESAAISKICDHQVSSLCQVLVLLAVEQWYTPYGCLQRESADKQAKPCPINECAEWPPPLCKHKFAPQL